MDADSWTVRPQPDASSSPTDSSGESADSDAYEPRSSAECSSRMDSISEHHPSLTRGSVVRQIFALVGPGEWLFVGLVNRHWRRLYRKSVRTSKVRASSTSFKSVCANVDTLKHALALGLDMSCEAPNFASAMGRFAPREVILYARQHDMPFSEGICTGAAQAQRYELLKWLHVERLCPWKVGHIARAIASSGRDALQTLDWLWHQPDGKWVEEDEVSRAAAAAGDTEVLQWLEDRGCLWDTHLCTEAARSNQLEALEWLVEHGFECDEWTCQAAATRGSLKVLKWLHDRGTPWIEQLIFDAAAAAGAVDMLEWLRGLGLGTWDEESLQEMLSIAGMCGHLTAAKWFRSQGAEWPSVLWHLDDGGVHGCWKLEALKWAIRAGCPWGEWPSAVCKDLEKLHQKEEKRWAHRNGCPCECDKSAGRAAAAANDSRAPSPAPSSAAQSV